MCVERGAIFNLKELLSMFTTSLTLARRRRRAQGKGDAADHAYDGVVNTLLSLMDGVNRLSNILVVGTTNRKDLIDPAFLRPGRHVPPRPPSWQHRVRPAPSLGTT
eukprot:1189982-Prorocentrum_minimum.AAC.1